MTAFTGPVAWTKGDPITAEKLQRMVKDALRGITVGRGLTIATTPDGKVTIGLVGGQGPITRPIRFKVTSNAPPGRSDMTVIGHRILSGEGMTLPEIITAAIDTVDTPIRVLRPQASGDEIWAFQPIGGTDATYGDNDLPVTWLQVDPLPFDVSVGAFVAGAGGMYTGTVVRPPKVDTNDDTSADVDASADEIAANFGTVDGAAVRILNRLELGRENSPHILHVGKVYPANFLHRDADGTINVEIFAGPDVDEDFEVDVTVTGGGTQGGTDDGTQTTPPVYSYNVFGKNGEELGLDKDVDWARPSNGSFAPGTQGRAWYAANGTLHLAQVDESAATKACTA